MRSLFGISAAIACFAVLAAAPFVLGEYGLGLMIGMASYVTLATAWSLFSGPTRNVSLATAAFFGVGAYTVAVLSETVPYPVVLFAALLIGGGMAVLAVVHQVSTCGGCSPSRAATAAGSASGQSRQACHRPSCRPTSIRCIALKPRRHSKMRAICCSMAIGADGAGGCEAGLDEGMADS